MAKEARKKAFTNQFDCDLSQDIVTIRNLTMRFPKVDSTDSGDGKYKTWQPGQPEYGEIEFTGMAHPDTIGDIKNWVKQNYNGDGKVTRRDITINLRQHQQETATRTFNLIGCYPKAFDYVDIAAGTQGSTVVRWTLSVRVQQVNMA